MTKDLRKKPRWIQKIYANLMGYFWLSCPICGEYFGGQEESGTLYQDMNSGVAVCINCISEADERNIKILRDLGGLSK